MWFHTLPLGKLQAIRKPEGNKGENERPKKHKNLSRYIQKMHPSNTWSPRFYVTRTCKGTTNLQTQSYQDQNDKYNSA